MCVFVCKPSPPVMVQIWPILGSQREERERAGVAKERDVLYYTRSSVLISFLLLLHLNFVFVQQAHLRIRALCIISDEYMIVQLN